MNGRTIPVMLPGLGETLPSGWLYKSICLPVAMMLPGRLAQSAGKAPERP